MVFPILVPTLVPLILKKGIPINNKLLGVKPHTHILEVYENENINAITIQHCIYGFIRLIQYKKHEKIKINRNNKSYTIYFKNRQLIVVCDDNIVDIINEDEALTDIKKIPHDIEDMINFVESYVQMIKIPITPRDELGKKLKKETKGITIVKDLIDAERIFKTNKTLPLLTTNFYTSCFYKKNKDKINNINCFNCFNCDGSIHDNIFT